MKKSTGSVHVCGLGIRVVSQVTLETNYLLQSIGRAFHCESNPAVSDYLESINCEEVNLFHLFEDGKMRTQVYQEVCDLVMRDAVGGDECVYIAAGHPVLLNSVVVNLRKATRENGLPFFVYPGLSSIDTIIADLFLPIGNTGIQCFEASHFVEIVPCVDTRVPLVLFQPGVVNACEVRHESGVNLAGVRKLQDILIDMYGAEQKWYLLRSAVAIGDSALMETGFLSELVNKADVLELGTLIIGSIEIGP